MPAFTTPTDIALRAQQIIGHKTLRDLDSDVSLDANDIRLAYDKLKVVELERNLWTFATRREILRALGIDSQLWTPPDWVAGNSYAVGAVVAYTPLTGVYLGKTFYWTIDTAGAFTTNPDLDARWHLYTGPVAIDLWAGGTYDAGEVVIVPATYAGGTTYAANDVVNSGGTTYVSLQGSNTGNGVTNTAFWTPWSTTGRSNKSFGVTASGSPIPLTYPAGYSIYLSLYNANADNPTAATGNWLSVGGTIKPLAIVWPLSTGPSADSQTNNIYRLPNGFLRRAPTDPKGNMIGYLGAASGVAPEDWVIEGNYLIGSSTSINLPSILLRFVADLVDVSDFMPMFCEGLAARIALDGGLQKDATEFAKAQRVYNRVIGEARMVNAIEVGPIAPFENRYVNVRV